ncbi:restriction endonuclease subunit S [uncultured Corynebacterium sp.]|uniref:restriction endonuclease subunit S n=1 Tax=uncultured Corynebacterium sp. TaxID=159447 RepID=UPI0028054C33|nr:restriction endonuclease subunit S [uncultured Corynebacterium sp.]
MSQWPMVKLGDVCERKIPKWDRNGKKKYIDISTVSPETKKVESPQDVLGEDAPSRAQQIIQTDDVLVSTVRPNLNAVAKIPSTFNGHIASTGFCVLRATEKIDPGFLFHFVQTQAFIQQCINKSTGISYPSTTANKIREIQIPLPPLEEQRRIAQVLTQTSLNISNTKQRIDLLNTICRTPIFANPSRPSTELKEYIRTISTGKSVKDTSDPNSGNKILKISAVTSGFFKGNETKYLPVEYSPKESHAVDYGNLLVSRANTSEMIGASALVDQDESNVFLPDKLWKIIPAKDVSKEAIWHLLQLPTIRKRMSQVATGSSGSMKNISQRSFLKVEVPDLTLSEISSITEVVKRILSTRKLLLKKLTLLEELHQSLATRAFAGQL